MQLRQHRPLIDNDGRPERHTSTKATRQHFCFAEVVPNSQISYIMKFANLALFDRPQGQPARKRIRGLRTRGPGIYFVDPLICLSRYMLLVLLI